VLHVQEEVHHVQVKVLHVLVKVHQVLGVVHYVQVVVPHVLEVVHYGLMLSVLVVGPQVVPYEVKDVKHRVVQHVLVL
jgi:hypothetical protein